MKNIGIYYRLGLVPNKESNVVIAISSADDSSLAAVRFAIDELKRSEPNWLKKIDDSNNKGTLQNKLYLFIYFHYCFLSAFQLFVIGIHMIKNTLSRILKSNDLRTKMLQSPS